MTAEQLEELLGKVTQGNWRVEQDTTLIWGHCDPEDSSDRGMGYPVAECRITPISSWAKGPDSDAGEANATLIALTPSLARRVIAAEKLVEAGNTMADAIEAGNPFSGHVGEWDEALTAYREASK